MKRTTIRDVARQAQVSTAVVSDVLNRTPKGDRIREDTRERIRKAAQLLNYRPSALARSLQQRRTRTLLLASNFDPHAGRSPVHTEILTGVLWRALALRYDVTVHALDEDDAEKPAVLGDGRADGCLWVSPRLDDAAISSVASAGQPLVILNARVPVAPHCVVADNRQGITEAVDHLAALGHRRLLFVGSADAWIPYDCRERAAAFIEACSERNLRADVIRADRLAEWLARRRGERPTAVLGWHDETAIHALKCARRSGLSVPRDLSVVGFDSTAACDAVRPLLTSVYQPLREIAERGVDCLVHAIETAQQSAPAQAPGEVLEFPCRLDVRESTGPAPANAW